MLGIYVNEIEYRELPLEPPQYDWLGERVVFQWPSGREQKGRVVEVCERNGEVRIEYWFLTPHTIAKRDFIVQPISSIRLAV